MDIIQEVNFSVEAIDTLLHDLYDINRKSTNDFKLPIPKKEYNLLTKIIAVHEKLNSDDLFSLSDKGLESFRDSVVNLMHFLKTKKEKRESDLENAINGSKIFNFKSYLINKEDKLKWYEVISFITLLILALIFIIGASYAAFIVTDNNYIIMMTGILYITIIFNKVLIGGSSKQSIKQTIGYSSHLLWKTIGSFTPLILLALLLGNSYKYFLDDVIVLIYIALPFYAYILKSKSEVWLKRINKVIPNTEPEAK